MNCATTNTFFLMSDDQLEMVLEASHSYPGNPFNLPILVQKKSKTPIQIKITTAPTLLRAIHEICEYPQFRHTIESQ